MGERGIQFTIKQGIRQVKDGPLYVGSFVIEEKYDFVYKLALYGCGPAYGVRLVLKRGGRGISLENDEHQFFCELLLGLVGPGAVPELHQAPLTGAWDAESMSVRSSAVQACIRLRTRITIRKVRALTPQGWVILTREKFACFSE